MTELELRNQLEEILNNLSDSELSDYWFEVCEENCDDERKIYDNPHSFRKILRRNESFAEYYHDMDAEERKEFKEDMNYDEYDDYYTFDGYDLTSGCDLQELGLDIEEIIDYIIENDDSMMNEEIRDLLDIYYNDDDDDELQADDENDSTNEEDLLSYVLNKYDVLEKCVLFRIKIRCGLEIGKCEPYKMSSDDFRQWLENRQINANTFVYDYCLSYIGRECHLSDKFALTILI